jgi:hypothetical protein
MSEESSAKSLSDKITMYDAFNALKERLPEYPRHTLEGAVIIASPSILMSNRAPGTTYGDVHDSRYKLRVAQNVIDSLMNYYEDSLTDKLDANAEVYKLLSLPVVYNYPGYGRRGINLPFVVTQIYNNVNEKKLPELCRNIGNITEKNLKYFYISRGYIIDRQNRPKDVASYLIAEYEFFTRIAAEMSNRSRKILL